MKWEQNRCPTCAEPAIHRAELVYVLVSLVHDGASGEYDFAGESDVNWDTQEPDVDDQGRDELWCVNSHYWRTKPVQEEPNGKDKETRGLVA